MKHISTVILSFALIACSSKSNHLTFDAGDYKLCIPSKYIVNAGGSGFPSGNYDPNGGGLDFSLLFSGEEIQQNIPTYKTRIKVNNSPRFQVIYLMLDKASHPIQPDAPTMPIPLIESPNLFHTKKLGTKTYTPTVAEKALLASSFGHSIRPGFQSRSAYWETGVLLSSTTSTKLPKANG